MATKEEVISLGMKLDKWTHESCTAKVGTGDDWATIYSIESDTPGQGHATALLIKMKEFYSSKGKVFGSSVALSLPMKHLLKKMDIVEYSL